jgi:hypothetical protein
MRRVLSEVWVRLGESSRNTDVSGIRKNRELLASQT